MTTCFHTTFICMKSDIQTQLNKNILVYSSALQCKKVQFSVDKFYWSKKLQKTEIFSFNLNIRVHGENFMTIFYLWQFMVIWFSTSTMEIFASLVYVFTMRVVIYDILSMTIISTLSTSILFCVVLYTTVDFTTQCVENRHTDIANFATLIHTKKMNTLWGNFYHTNYYPPHGEFKLISTGKFSRRTWVNST